jgi:hypothetical protein
MNNRKKQLAVVGGSFIAGMAFGVLSSQYAKKVCEESFKSDKAEVIRELKNQQKEFMLEMNRKLSNFRSRVRKELHEPIPDLYKATEGLTLNEHDVELEH